MRSAAYTGNGTIEILESEAAPPPDGQVQVRVAFVGLCGTDLHIVHGAMDARVTTPLIFGHEMSGTIENVGEGVDGWAVGDPVTVMPLAWDGTCPACLAGHHHICQNLDFIGIDSPGALQTLWNVPAHTLVALPAGLALDVAALVEPTAVAVHDVRRGEVAAGDHVVVLGGGPIGVLIATVARHAGAAVAIVEPDPDRRAQIEQLGHVAIDPALDRPGRLGRRVDRRRRCRRGLRGLRRCSCRGRRHRAGQGPRNDRRRRDPRRPPRGRPQAGLLARASAPRRPRLRADRLRDGELPARRRCRAQRAAHLPGRAADRRCGPRSTISSRGSP